MNKFLACKNRIHAMIAPIVDIANDDKLSKAEKEKRLLVQAEKNPEIKNFVFGVLEDVRQSTAFPEER